MRVTAGFQSTARVSSLFTPASSAAVSVLHCQPAGCTAAQHSTCAAAPCSRLLSTVSRCSVGNRVRIHTSYPADLWHCLDCVEAVDWEAAVQEDDKGVTRPQRHRVLLGQLNEGVVVAVESNFAAWTQQQETQSNKRSTRTCVHKQDQKQERYIGQHQERYLTRACLAAGLHAATRTWHCLIPWAGLVEGDAKLEGGARLHQCLVKVLNCLDEVGCSKRLRGG